MRTYHLQSTVQAIAIILPSLSRYDSYIQNVAGCSACQKIWRKLQEQREKGLSLHPKELKDQVEAGKLSW